MYSCRYKNLKLIGHFFYPPMKAVSLKNIILIYFFKEIYRL